MTREPFERALERCVADPQFEARLRSVYHGRHDVMDALWWAAHPLTTTPRGKPDPAAELRALQNAVFSRQRSDSPLIEVTDPETGASAQMREDEHRLSEAQRLLAADAAHLSAALNAVEQADVLTAVPAPAESPVQAHVMPGERETRAPPARPAVSPVHGAMGDDQLAQNGYGVFQTPGEAAARARRLLLPVLSGVALLAAVVILPSVSRVNTGTVGVPTPSPGLSQAPRIITDIVTIRRDDFVQNPLSILDRPQTRADHPPDGLAMHRVETYRLLPRLLDHVRLYLARDQEDTVCLVAVRNDDSGTSGCTEEALFPEQGIRFSADERYVIGVDATILRETFELAGDGYFHYEATARVRQPYQPPR